MISPFSRIAAAIKAFFQPGVLGPTEPIGYSEIPPFKDVYLVDVEIGDNGNGGLNIEMCGKIVGGKVTFSHTKIQGQPCETSLQTAIRALIDDPTDQRRVRRTRHTDAAGHRNKATPMSFNGKGDCFIVYRLTNTNAFFTQETFAIKKEEGLSSNILPWMRRVDDCGLPLPYDKDYDSSNPVRNKRTKMAVLAYRKPNASAHLARFNLYLDIVEDTNDPVSPYVPIIVDPDVRFPGGNGDP
ncbi:hypothetical protein GCM10023115_01190 [Pontixanthobacter gangjinensis]|uniref:Uncharacterized protein n=1 Tax=Pontixanthobacter gangjinensis TaxID=1028742 RepID=A0A6I4SIF8_9SPHN|nr:hypothetical protein [Pontixanthobacter gangjinensis]MXO55375.1 hypothetical protein [Pontixanthobacter gangjinensis]